MKNYAIVFPGQGSQSLQMLATYCQQHQDIVDLYCHKASNVLGYDIAKLISEDPENKLNQTEFTQPALLVAGVIAWKIWQRYAITPPKFFAGHSLGEYTALTCANSLAVEDAVALVKARGQYMQSAVPEGIGAMAAIIGLDDEVITALCQKIGSEDDITPANFNSLGQVVLAGKREAIEAAIIAAKAAGAKIATLLPVSVPSHCRLMLPAAEQLRHDLEKITINSPEIPVINNADVAIENSPEKIKAALIKQLYSPVRWVETVQKIQAQQISTIVECGPGKILTGLIKRIDKEINVFSANQEDAVNAFIENKD